MSYWSRNYNHNNDPFEVSKETQRYIEHLQYKSDYSSFLEDEEDDITPDLMTRIQMNENIKAAPKEVRAARKVIQNWLQIEKEAECIRHHRTYTKTSNIRITKTNPTNHISIKNRSKKIIKSPSTSAFDAKFAKMKTRAIKREKKQHFTNIYTKKTLFDHKQNKTDVKQMMKKAFEHKEEEFEPLNDIQNIQNIHNAEQKLRYDLIPSSKINKTNEDKQRYLKKMETKKVLLFQLNEIEKQEKFHEKKLKIQIWSEWKKQIIKSYQIEQNVIHLYRNNLLKHSFIEWMHYIYTSRQIVTQIFREWIKMRLISQENEIKAIEFYEYGLQDNVFFVWRDYTKHSIGSRKIRTMQIQSRLYKMNKIAARHHKYSTFCKFIKHWKQYTNHQQNQRYLEQQREQRKLKIKKLIHSVKYKAEIKKSPKPKSKSITCNEKKTITHKTFKKRVVKNTQTQTLQTSANVECDDIKENKTISQSVQTKKVNNIKQNKDKPRSSLHSLKPSKMVIKMQQRALERKQKREQLLELKKQKEKEHQAFILKQKQMEIERMKEEKRLEREQKLEKLQKQMYLKEIENNKLILSQLHYKRSLMIYHGWIPWMKFIELNNIYFHRILLIRNDNLQKRFWCLWRAVINKRKRTKANAREAAYIGRVMMSNKLFVMKIEERYWTLWKEIILKYKMMHAMIAERRKLAILCLYLKKWGKHYEMRLNEKRLQQHMNEQKANKHGDIVLIKRVMRRWKQASDDTRKEKQKARTWRKVEVWLTELRANR